MEGVRIRDNCFLSQNPDFNTPDTLKNQIRSMSNMLIMNKLLEKISEIIPKHTNNDNK